MIRKEPAYDSIFLVALTGYGQSSDQDAVRNAGFDDHLVKPLQPEVLSSLLTKSFRTGKHTDLTVDK